MKDSFETGQDFTYYWVNEVCEESKNIPSWITVDYALIYGRINSQKIMLRLIAQWSITLTDTFLRGQFNENIYY